jgi:glycosyltransferase involved in cell wall biosynthesis
LLQRTLREFRASNADIVFSSGDSYVGYLGLRLARRLSAKAVFDIYDDYSYFGSNKIPFMQTLLKSATSQSDLVTCASESIEEKYGVYQENTLLVQNGVDKQIFRPEERHIVRQRSNIPAESIVVGYLGSIHIPRGADDLIAALKLLRARGQEITLLMAGLDLGEVDLDYPWIDYRGMLEQRKVVDLINACDVVTIPYQDTELIRMTNACKLMEYIACRVPVVVSDVSDYASYFPENFGCVSKPADPESLANAIANQLINKNIVGEDRVLTWDDLAARLDAGIKALA